MSQKHKTPKAFTYFDSSAENVEVVTKRLLEWRDNWKTAGYDPVVLNSHKVIPQPTVQKMMERMGGKPAVAATFLKWFAAAVACPPDEMCIFADYRVFNYGFVPDMNAGRLASKKVNVLYELGTTNVIFGGKEALLRQANMFGHYTPPLPIPMPDAPPSTLATLTDLDILKHQEVNAPELSATIDVCRPYGDLTGWEDAKLVRFDDLSVSPRSLRDWNDKLTNRPSK